MATTNDVVLSSFNHGAVGVPNHISTVVLDVTGILSEHDVEAFASGDVDGIAREPTHTVLANVSGVVGIGSIGGHTKLGASLAFLVDGSMATGAESAGIALRLGEVVALFDDRAACPLGSVGGEDNSYAGHVGQSAEVDGLAISVDHELTLKFVFVLAQLSEGGIIGHIIGIVESGVEGLCGNQAIGAPESINNILKLLLFIESLRDDTGLGSITRHPEVEVVLIEVGLGNIVLGGEALEIDIGVLCKLSAGTNPVVDEV